MSKGIFEKVAADKTQLGFEYQDLVCLEYLIDMKQGEVVGLEVFDDVHHERIDRSNALVQVKHSIDDGKTLTNRDIDFWKTIYNWSQALEELDSREIEFIFFTNKKKTNQTGIIMLIESDRFNINALNDVINDIKKDVDSKENEKVIGAAENPIKKYVDHIFHLNGEKKEKLFRSIKFSFSENDIFSRLTKKIEFFSISEHQSLDVLHQLLGVFKKKKYELIKANKKILIDYETFRKQFEFNRIIQISQDRKIDFSRYHQFKIVNTIDPKDGIFSKQLADIEVSSEEILEQAIEYAATSMFIQTLIVSGNFSESENNAINEELIYGWRALHDRLYDQDGISSNEQHNRIARNCYRGVGGINISVANSLLSSAMVKGKGIELSDHCRIGWRKDWKCLYGDK